MTIHFPSVAGLPLSRRGREARRDRSAALAAWAPWGPAARRRPRRGLTLRYLVLHSLDMVVVRAGEPLGRVEEIVVRPYDFWPVELIVRTPSGDRVRVPATHVAGAEPREGRLHVAGGELG